MFQVDYELFEGRIHTFSSSASSLYNQKHSLMLMCKVGSVAVSQFFQVGHIHHLMSKNMEHLPKYKC